MRHSEEVIKKAKKLYIEGNSAKAIGKELEISKSTVESWIEKHGWIYLNRNLQLEKDILIIQTHVSELYKSQKLAFRSLNNSVKRVVKFLEKKRIIKL